MGKAIPEATFSVVRSDILSGKKRSHLLCPVALAVKREFPSHKHCYAWITPKRIVLGFQNVFKGKDLGGYVEYAFKSPPKVQSFVHRFDRGLRVKPIRFKVGKWIGHYLREGAPREHL